MVEVPMFGSEYIGPKTPFGGPSLEWQFANTTLKVREEGEEEARIGVRNIPFSITGLMAHLRRSLEEYPKNTATVHRKVLATGLPIIERLVSYYPTITSRIEKSLLDSSDSDMRDFMMKKDNNYVFKLGEKDDASHSIYAENKDQTSRIRNIAEDIGLPAGQVVILCLTAGLAQSLDSSWIPVKFRNSFIDEIRFFEKWLATIK